MEGPYSERPWFWVTLMLSSITLAAIVFAAWELVENRFFRDLDYVTLHYLYITRGIASSLLLACWAAWYVLRQRIRLQRHLLEIEKLTSMGKMAAGTAHHLNTPLAAMLLRVQMMRDRAPENVDLERLESGLRFCQHFVQRLLEFSRRPAPARQPEDVAHVLDCVLSFLAPQSLACKARISTEIEYGRGRMVTADRNQSKRCSPSWSATRWTPLKSTGMSRCAACRQRRAASPLKSPTMGAASTPAMRRTCSNRSLPPRRRARARAWG